MDKPSHKTHSENTMELKDFIELSKQTADDISRFINCADDLDMKLLAEKMARDHRTLVQKKMRLMLLFVEQLAKDLDGNYFDLRNEHACKIAKKICDTIPTYERTMPHI